MKIGICGYGNVGRAVEDEAIRQGINVEVIFSRRKDVLSPYMTHFEPLDDIEKWADSLDVVLMCGGSQKDLEWQSPAFLQYVPIVDSFDTHARIEEHYKNLDKIAKKFRNTAVYSCGWDPGLFSVARTLFSNIVDCDPITFWGKGVSQGHSQALREVDGVSDAIQYTVPNKSIQKTLESYPEIKVDGKKLHTRECVIALDGSRSQESIEKEIKEMPNYFKGQDVFISVMAEDDVKMLKKDMSHCGEVIAGDDMSSIILKANMKDNPHFTAKIMLAYAKAIPFLDPGAYSVLDIPVSLIGGKQRDNLKML